MEENYTIFNGELLSRKLNNFNIDDIPNWIDKIKIINGWKKSIEQHDLNKTKEKQLQGVFFTDFFCRVLGYKTQIGRNEWNFIQEQKTKADATTPDGVLGFFNNKDKNNKDVRVVIELKDVLTNLDTKQKGRDNNISPVGQAFSYPPKFGDECKWVIVSNFKEIRLYRSTNEMEYETFEVTKLVNIEEFKRFYYLLNSKNLICKNNDSVTDSLYNSKVEKLKNITNKFYKEYKEVRLKLFKGMKENNPLVDELILFEKAQKLMDRFIFICFCENKDLLPKSTFKNVLTTARKSFDPSDDKIWIQLKGLFHAIDKGNPPMNINRFNGGLFAVDTILDQLRIPDELFTGLEEISLYYFDASLDVNILGHIFEQNIGDIEEIKSEIKGENINKKEGKRKKDGIFYTPEYVTNYIVSKCIGDWLAKKRKELGEDKLPVIPEGKEGYVPKISGKRQKLTARQVALEKHRIFWVRYGEVLSNIKILDPACGSGAFLNAAFDYLLNEANRVNEKHIEITQTASLFDLTSSILKNNLYGVDLNEESVEITKLSLWLKTANKRDPLTSLDKNIFCGNSLISDENIGGKKAFKWNEVFKEIIDNGGFDIIIGNPPYGAKLTDLEKKYLSENYKTTQYNYDTYKFFLELSGRLSKKDGYIGLITPNTYFVLEKSNLLREYLFDNFKLVQLIEVYKVFPDAIVEPIISIYINEKPVINDKFDVICVPREVKLNNNFIYAGVKTSFSQTDLKRNSGYLFNYHETEIEKNICEKIIKKSQPLIEYLNVTTGIKPYQTNKGIPQQTKEIVKTKPFNGFEKLDSTWKPYMKGENIDKYVQKWDGEYIKYGKWIAEPRNPEIFEKEKIFIRQTSDTLIATYDDTGKIGKNTLHCIHKKKNMSNINLKFILGLINSKLLNWIFQHDNFHIVGKPLAETKVTYVNRLPIIYPEDTTLYTIKVDMLLEKNQERYDIIKKFVKFIEVTYLPTKVSNKLWDFYNLEYIDFVKELKKQKVKLNEMQKFELSVIFNKQKEEIKIIDLEINNINNELDMLIYKLYGLSDDEIKIIDTKSK